MNYKEFIKKYSGISNKFIDLFLSFYNVEESSFDININLEKVSNLVNVNKGNLKQILITKTELYKKNIDYTIEHTPNMVGRGATLKEKILISPDCFKNLCISINNSTSHEIRKYFIRLEYLLFKYKSYIIDGLNKKINKLENNQKKVINTKKGVIYVFMASDNTIDELFKIGYTYNINKRVKTYNTGLADNIELLFVYEVDDIKSVNKCVKSILDKHKYRSSKEIYKMDLETIKEVIVSCEKITLRVENRKELNKITKNNQLFMVLDK